jgi:hypothetical protein
MQNASFNDFFHILKWLQDSTAVSCKPLGLNIALAQSTAGLPVKIASSSNGGPNVMSDALR